ncbi:MAG: TRAM domain-containing protein [Halobacteriota archaeon]
MRDDSDDAPTPQPSPSASRKPAEHPEPPVEEGDVREVTIESTGDQGDGIAKVDRGFVVIVPGARPGDDVTVEIESVQPNYAVANVVGDESAATW